MGGKRGTHLDKYHNKVKCCKLNTILNLCSAIPRNVIIACLILLPSIGRSLIYSLFTYHLSYVLYFISLTVGKDTSVFLFNTFLPLLLTLLSKLARDWRMG